MTVQMQQEIVKLLEDCSSNDNSLIKKSTALLQSQLSKNKAWVVALLPIAQSHNSPHIRQLAAIECSKRIPKHWKNIPQNDKNQIKSLVLEMVKIEEHSLTRLALSRVISQIAKIELPLNLWQDLVPFIFNCCNSNLVYQREVGLSVLFTLFDILVDILEGQYENLLKNLLLIFQTTIDDAESFSVRLYTLRFVFVNLDLWVKFLILLNPQTRNLFESFKTWSLKWLGF